MTEETKSLPPRVLVLVATIPARKISCERMLVELTRQSRKPDGVVLVLDGYGDEAPAPACPLPVVATYRTATASGPGARWRVANDLPAEDILICLDDDATLREAPKLIAMLAAEIEAGASAAAAMGLGTDGRRAPPGTASRGELVYAAGCGLTARAGTLVGLQNFAGEIKNAGGPDALGVFGDDDALVSAYLWKNGVRIRHAATGNIFAASGSKATSQTAARNARHEDPDAQKLAIKRITGWPWQGKTGGQARV